MTAPWRSPASSPAAPLAHVRVLDLTTILAGPYATMLLGDLGADVIKIESPKGDGSRQWGPPWAGGESAYFLGVNRNKRGIVLDLTSERHRDVLLALVDSADVLIENFKAGTMQRWGLDYETVLRPRNEGLIYGSITGFGSKGPAAHLPGFAPLIEATSGMMSITGEPGGPPLKTGVALVDILTGTQAALGLVAALHARTVTGKGQRVDVSLLETALSSLANQASSFLLTGDVPKRQGNEHPAIVPYQTFSARDRDVMVCAGTDRQFQNLCIVLGKPHLATDARFATNPMRVKHRVQLIPLLADAIRAWPAEALCRAANERKVPVAAVNDLGEAFSHEQVAALRSVVAVEHPVAGVVRQVRSPIRMSETSEPCASPPPMKGEHSIEVLLGLGYSTEEAASIVDCTDDDTV